MKTLLLVLMVFAPKVCLASDPHEELVHFAAHVGMSFALQTTLYGVNHKWFNMEKGNAQAVAFVETMMIGVAYKAMEGFPDNTPKAFMYNTLGAVSAVSVGYTFSF